MEKYKGCVCVTFAELTGGERPVMSRTTYQNLVIRKEISIARRGCNGRVALYDFQSLPAKYRRAFIERHGNPVELLAEPGDAGPVPDRETKEWFAAYTYLKNGAETHLEPGIMREYVANATALRELMDCYNTMVSTRNRCKNPYRRSDLWKKVGEECERLRGLTGHTLPKSLERLKERMRRYKAEGFRSLVSGKLGNAHTLKITGEVGEYLLALKRSRVPVYTNAQIFAKYNGETTARNHRLMEAGEKDRGKYWKPLRSLSNLRAWYESAEVKPLWYDAVYGDKKARERYSRQHRTLLPSMRDSLWYGDGTKINLYYRVEGDNTRKYSVNVYEIMDAYSEVFLGYYIYTGSEEHTAQMRAFRMALQRSGHKPYEVVYDNQSGYKLLDKEGFFDKVCRTHRPTAPYNGRSKTIEAAFGRFQAEVLHRDWAFTGQNVTARRRDSRPNLEFIDANIRNLPTLPELMAKYARMREEWNNAARTDTGKTRLEMYEESVNPETEEITDEDMVDIFWVRTRKPVTFTSGGITITVNGREHTYEVYERPGVPDHEWRRRHTYEKFYVMYDPNDMGTVRLYSVDKAGGTHFERTASTYMTIHRGRQEQTAEERAFIAREHRANEEDRVERYVAAKAVEYAHGTAPEQHGLVSDRPLAMSASGREEIDRRLAKYRELRREAAGEPVGAGRTDKALSLETFDGLEAHGEPVRKDPDVEELSAEEFRRRCAGKL